MFAPRKLDSERTSLEDAVEEAQFTKLTVRNTQESKALIATADKLYKDAEAQLTQERALYAAVLEAEVRIVIGNRGLDGWTGGFRGLLENKEASGAGTNLFSRFFGSRRPSDVIKMALGSQIGVMEPWIESLKADADPELKAQGAELEKLITTGKAAVAAHKAARQAVRDFRAGPRAAAFAQVNSGRLGLFGDLSELPRGKDPAWTESFFRTRRAPEEPDEPTVAEATAALATQRAALAAAEAQLEAAKQREALTAAAALMREAKEKEREAARKEAAALRRRLAELDEELNR